MKKIILFLCIICLICSFTACNKSDTSGETKSDPIVYKDAIDIVLNDDGITVSGSSISTDSSSAVYSAHDIVYYESGKDFTYGEGTEGDSHTSDEGGEHTVVHITKAGTYRIQGKLSKGQIAVDLNEDAKEDPSAVVTLILNGVDITCEVAPAVIFYSVYECADADTEGASKDVDTTAAGANIVIADETVNTVNGSYVARIYKPGTVVLSEDGSAVEDAKKLHKYDGAFYSKMSMNISGEPNNTGRLIINAENEGLDSELHLTVNGGNIDIISGNDGINTNEDGVSVTTINGGNVTLKVTGKTGEGDGIDSNGWLVINGGTVKAYACSTSGDAGIDSDMGIYINGGTVIATGNMLDKIAGAEQNCAIFNFESSQSAGSNIVLKSSGKSILETELVNNCSILIYSAPELDAGTYKLFVNGTQFGAFKGGEMNKHEGINFGGEEIPDMPEGKDPSNMEGGQQTPQMPDGGQRPEMQDGQQPPQMPEGQLPTNIQGGRPGNQNNRLELSDKLEISDGVNEFYSVSEYTPTNNNFIWIIIVGIIIVGLIVYATIVTVKLIKNKKRKASET